MPSVYARNAGIVLLRNFDSSHLRLTGKKFTNEAFSPIFHNA